MTGLLSKLFRGSVDRVREEKLSSTPVRWPRSLKDLPAAKRRHLEELVIFGVLMHEVADADGHFAPEEEKAISTILKKRGDLAPAEVALVIAAARESAEHRMDIQGFTREINKKTYTERIRVVELLFTIALADNDLSIVELEKVRKIAKLLWVSHKDFIAAKLRVRDH